MTYYYKCYIAETRAS